MASAGSNKFDALGDVDLTQRDVFETPDAPENVQGGAAAKKATKKGSVAADIDETSVEAGAAFEKFAHGNLNTASADYSERIIAKAWVRERANLERVGAAPRGLESPADRFSRLEAEIQDLFTEVEEIKKQNKENKFGVRLPENMSEEVMKLRDQLRTAQEVRLEGTGASSLEQRLEGEVKRLGKTDGKSGGADGKVVYELYCPPGNQGGGASAGEGMVELEKRITAMEKAVGVGAVDSSTPVNLHSAIEKLRSQIQALESSGLESISAQAQSTTALLDSLIKQRDVAMSAGGDAAAVAAGREARVDELLKMVEGWQGWNEGQLDFIVDRLTALKEVHDECLAFGSTFKRVNEDQSHLSETLKTQKEALDTVQANFAENVKIIQENMKSMEGRMEALQKKMSK